MKKVWPHACDVCECMRLRVRDFDKVPCPELTLAQRQGGSLMSGI